MPTHTSVAEVRRYSHEFRRRQLTLSESVMANSDTHLIWRGGPKEAPRAAGCMPGTAPMTSVLFLDPQNSIALAHAIPPQPDHFVDLNLDQAVDAIIGTRPEFNLIGIFRHPLLTQDEVQYRHEVFRDLQEPTLQQALTGFSAQMREMRSCLAQAEKLYYPHQMKRWHIEAIVIYCEAVIGLGRALHASQAKSRAVGVRFQTFLRSYIDTPQFKALHEETHALLAQLDGLAYCIHVNGDTLSVRHYENETDYSKTIAATFEKFRQGAVKNHSATFHEYPEMNQIEAKILEFVAKLNPAPFQHLDDLYARTQGFLDATVAEFDREIQFYLAYLEHMKQFETVGRQFCYPEMSEADKHVYTKDCFDLALGKKLMSEGKTVVCNDFELDDGERMIVVSGPNQGGKTTFARMFGQQFYLASLGCPVPGTQAKLLLADQIFTHFERREDINNLRGKLKDDLERIHHILRSASSRSVLVMNEIFTSTSLADALFLSEKVMQEAIGLDVLGVWVTFIDELASYGKSVVSMISSVDAVHEKRTFRIIKAPAAGRSYAMSLADKYGLTPERMMERMNHESVSDVRGA
jgi:DNA mismatch repair ATPase MutS